MGKPTLAIQLLSDDIFLKGTTTIIIIIITTIDLHPHYQIYSWLKIVHFVRGKDRAKLFSCGVK